MRIEPLPTTSDTLSASAEARHIGTRAAFATLALWFIVLTANGVHHIRTQSFAIALCVVNVAGLAVSSFDWSRRSSTRWRSAEARACDPLRVVLPSLVLLFGAGLAQWLARAITGGMQEYLNVAYMAALPLAIARYLRYRHNWGTYH